MASVKRLCPECGAANSLERERCHACGADMRSNLPVPGGERLPVPWKQVGTSLAVGAGALALRVGLHAVRHLLARKAARSLQLREQTGPPNRVGRWLSRRQETEKAPRPTAQVRVWGQRLRGRLDRDGASELEVEEFYWQADSN
jgi:hypothetical protein